MNLKIVKNKYINAGLLLMLFSAVIHMIILFVLSVISRDVYVLNYFNILDLDLWYPAGFNSSAGNSVALIAVVIIYLVMLKLSKSA